MKVIHTGNQFNVYDSSIETLNTLPPKSYIVRFHENRGFYLEGYPDVEARESKIYGVHEAKVDKVLRSFDAFGRNLGVILSGDKGIGKSLFARLLASKAQAKGIPLIVVDTYYHGIASFLEQIDQEVMVLFDEFDKTFGGVEEGSGKASPQTHLLSLFDGVSPGKKLYVITCNNIYKLNDYIVNRPGRFHYHFRFSYPTPEEVREYLQDNTPESAWPEIDNVISFSKKVLLNYDCLRAIAFEISSGLTFKDAAGDLNIVNTESYRYEVTLLFRDGTKISAKNVNLDIFSDEEMYICLYDTDGRNYADVRFHPSDCIYDAEKFANIITPERITIEYDEDTESYKDIITARKEIGAAYLIITREVRDMLHYKV